MGQGSPYGEILEMGSGYGCLGTLPRVRLRDLRHGRSDLLTLGPATWVVY